MKRILPLFLGLIATLSAQQVSASTSDEAALKAYNQMVNSWTWRSTDYMSSVQQMTEVLITTPSENDENYGKTLYLEDKRYDLTSIMDFNYDADTGAVSLYLPYGQTVGQLGFSGYGLCDIVILGWDGTNFIYEGGAIACVNDGLSKITFEENTILVYSVYYNGEHIGDWSSSCDISIIGYRGNYNGMTFTVDNYSDKTCALTDGRSCSGNVVIPSKVMIGDDWYTVTSIYYDAFYECVRLLSVVVPDTVTMIYADAFSRCIGLTSINIPNSVTLIMARAFSECSSLTSINIPNSVRTIGEMAFFGCSSVTEINVASGNPSYTSIDGILFSKDLKTLIQFPPKKTGDYEIPKSVTTIGVNAFVDCSGLTSIVIPDSVTTIGWGAFQLCSGLTTIDIPDGVTIIDQYIFNGCSGLTSVKIPDSVTGISFGAFQNCSGLTSINIPASVTVIAGRAFLNCSRLTTMNVYAEIPPLCTYEGHFEGVPADCVLHVPVGTRDDYAAAPGWSVFINIVDDLQLSGVEEIFNDVVCDTDSDTVTVYNLQGVKMNVTSRDNLSSLPAGYYIVNGKKMLLK